MAGAPTGRTQASEEPAASRRARPEWKEAWCRLVRLRRTERAFENLKQDLATAEQRVNVQLEKVARERQAAEQQEAAARASR